MDDFLRSKIARKELELLRAIINVLFEDEQSEFCDSDNEFTMVTKKHKRRFNWSEKQSPTDRLVETYQLRQVALFNE